MCPAGIKTCLRKGLPGLLLVLSLWCCWGMSCCVFAAGAAGTALTWKNPEDKVISVSVGEKRQLEVLQGRKRVRNSSLYWTSSKPSVVHVNENGEIYAARKGSAVVACRWPGSKAGKLTCKVTVKGNVDYIAHRGAVGRAPENTLRGFIIAAKRGFKRTETDIRQTADGQWILLHDKNFSRMCGCDLAPGQMTLKEVEKLKIISGSNIEKYSNDPLATRIPTYKEFLKVCKQYKLIPHVHIKDSYEDVSGKKLQEEMQRLFEETKAVMQGKEVLFLSSNMNVLIQLQKVAKSEQYTEMRFSLLVDRINSENISLCHKHGFGMSSSYKYVTQNWVNRCIRKHIELNLWTVKNRTILRRYRAMGVWLFTTNLYAKFP